MGYRTKIEWSDSSWSPVTGCTKVSLGCDHCYAERIAERFRGAPTYPNGFEVTLRPERLDVPDRWRKPRMVFVCSMADLFHREVPDDFLDEVFGVMERNGAHTFQVLTKRPQRMARYVARLYGEGQPPSNLWFGTSVENQDYAWRLDHLSRMRGRVRFVSAEPLLGALDLRGWLSDMDWIIVGGESGPGYRPMDEAWARGLLAQARESGTALFMKQMAGRAPIPEGLRVREFPL